MFASRMFQVHRVYNRAPASAPYSKLVPKSAATPSIARRVEGPDLFSLVSQE